MGDGLWLACCLEDAIGHVPLIMRVAGYKSGSMCIWREGTQVAAYWVHRPGEEGGIAAGSFAEAVEFRDRLIAVGVGGFLIRQEGANRPIMRREGQRLMAC